jgi:hypothetical protein
MSKYAIKKSPKFTCSAAAAAAAALFNQFKRPWVATVVTNRMLVRLKGGRGELGNLKP